MFALLLLAMLAQSDLLAAASAGDRDAVEAALEAGAEIEAVDGEGRTPLMLAAEAGHLDVVEHLVDEGANVDARAANGWSVLLRADAADRPKVVELLYRRGASLLSHDVSKFDIEWDADPVLVSKPRDPDYPDYARKHRISGKVHMTIRVGLDGDTEVTGVPGGLLFCTAAAIDNARQWRWKPASKDGEPVVAYGMITVSFDLIEK